MSDDFEKRITQLEVLTEEKWANHAVEAGQFREDTRTLISSGYIDLKKELHHQFELLTKVMDNRFQIMQFTLDGISALSNKCAEDIIPLKNSAIASKAEHDLTKRWSGWLAGIISVIVSAVIGTILKLWIK